METKNLNKLIYFICIGVILVFAMFIFMPKGNRNIDTYVDRGNTLCDNNFQKCNDIIYLNDNNEDTIPQKIVKVYGTLYRTGDMMVIYGFCLNYTTESMESNATVKLKNYLNDTLFYINMTDVSDGEFINNITTPNETGVFSLIFRCEWNGGYGFATNEIQVPDWINILINQTKGLNTSNITTGVENKLDNIIDFLGIKSKNLTLDIIYPIYSYYGKFWSIKALVKNQYSVIQDNNKVYCEVNTSNWGIENMSYYNNYFRYKKVVDIPDINFTVGCEYI